MPVFLEDPSQFSKERLKSELIAHNVALPPGESKKQEYLELYLKNVDAKNAADFSSDEEEDQPAQVDGQEQRPEEPDMWDLTGLPDEDLKARLLQHGFQAGPITATTRLVYEKKLRRLMEPKIPPQLNGSPDQAVYSDSEEEEKGEEEELPGPETVACVEKDTVGSKCQVPVTDVLMEIFPEMEKTPTGISATRRRPIKGAAGRPVQFKYPDTPLSPNSVDQREVQRRQVPLWVQLLIFALVSSLLYLAYAAAEESLESPLTLLLDGVAQAAAALQEEVAAPSVDDAPVMADAAAPPLLGE
ncbi:LEM domain-containing protein 1 isoform X3 [Alosa pseudoharengus]|uniref:LEM domain-containing protein 1 isoform X3 n=1 Tax=Alosa pseudoharengus TaxID=34774 RepID=UPI003F8936A3